MGSLQGKKAVLLVAERDLTGFPAWNHEAFSRGEGVHRPSTAVSW